MQCRLSNTHPPDRADTVPPRQGVRMPSSVKARLIIIVLAGSAASLAGAEDLRGPETFASITNQSERSRALFVEAGRVLQHPRCLNCHPVGERPTQGNDSHPHSPPVLRGPDDKGAIGFFAHTSPPNTRPPVPNPDNPRPARHPS